MANLYSAAVPTGDPSVCDECHSTLNGGTSMALHAALVPPSSTNVTFTYAEAHGGQIATWVIR